MVKHGEAVRKHKTLLNKFRFGLKVVIDVGLLREELCRSFRRHDEFIHHLANIRVGFAVRGTCVGRQLITSVNNKVPGISFAGDLTRVLDLDGVATHISTLHIVDLIYELWVKVLSEDIKAGNGHIIFHRVVWPHLDPDSLNVFLNLNVLLKCSDSVRDEKFLASEAVEREVSISLLRDCCLIRCDERAIIVD